MRSGLFIDFEGLDGCGKSTQAKLLISWLEELGFQVVHSLEPNEAGSPIGREIKKMLRGDVPKPDMLEFQRHYVIDRAQDLAAFILPALRQGKVYLIERFALSTLAFGQLGNLSVDRLLTLHTEVMGPLFRWPDVTIIFDLPPEVAIGRIARNRKEVEYFEKLPMLKQVRANYLELQKNPAVGGQIKMVDGTKSVTEIFDQIKAIIEPQLESVLVGS